MTKKLPYEERPETMHFRVILRAGKSTINGYQNTYRIIYANSWKHAKLQATQWANRCLGKNTFRNKPWKKEKHIHFGIQNPDKVWEKESDKPSYIQTIWCEKEQKHIEQKWHNYIFLEHVHGGIE